MGGNPGNIPMIDRIKDGVSKNDSMIATFTAISDRFTKCCFLRIYRRHLISLKL